MKSSYLLVFAGLLITSLNAQALISVRTGSGVSASPAIASVNVVRYSPGYSGGPTYNNGITNTDTYNVKITYQNGEVISLPAKSEQEAQRIAEILGVNNPVTTTPSGSYISGENSTPIGFFEQQEAYPDASYSESDFALIWEGYFD